MCSNDIFALEKKLIAYCGFYCRLCPFYTGEFKKKFQDILNYIKHLGTSFLKEICEKHGYNFDEFWRVLEFFSKSKLCLSCKMGDGWPDCPIRKCAIERKVEYCAFCSDYPCETMKRLGYTKYADELKIGVENFLKKKLECE